LASGRRQITYKTGLLLAKIKMGSRARTNAGEIGAATINAPAIPELEVRYPRGAWAVAEL
jgi:hypothetical protein